MPRILALCALAVAAFLPASAQASAPPYCVYAWGPADVLACPSHNLRDDCPTVWSPAYDAGVTVCLDL
ncbi:MAG TPA: hypothetical protein VFQ85_00595 [Mycobacteriales bacterium]|jgi:hypothetical protein|nr:hypothetical protein [Mycobacteriales bacterium]